jgi:NADH:ubiquinone oxidoreductase subunit 4 (subunit M)
MSAAMPGRVAAERREVVVLVPVLALLLVFGVAPNLLTDRIDPATEAVIAHVAPDHRTDVGVTGAAVADAGLGMAP